MLDLILLPIFQRAFLAGITLAIVMAIIGVFIVLRRMSFFSDAIGHSALTGIALGSLLELNPYASALVFALLVAAGISLVRIKSKLTLDTLLGVFFSGSVALGVILVQLTPGYQADLISFLFGDILTVSSLDLYVTIIVSIASLLIILFTGKSFIAITFDSNLAKAEGIKVNTYELIFLLLLAAIVALAIKLVGVILVTGLLIIPAATAHNITRSLTAMFIGSIVISLSSIILGMLLSITLNIVTGPTIVLTGSIFFILSLLLRPVVKST